MRTAPCGNDHVLLCLRDATPLAITRGTNTINLNFSNSRASVKLACILGQHFVAFEFEENIYKVLIAIMAMCSFAGFL